MRIELSRLKSRARSKKREDQRVRTHSAHGATHLACANERSKSNIAHTSHPFRADLELDHARRDRWKTLTRYNLSAVYIQGNAIVSRKIYKLQRNYVTLLRLYD